MNTTPVNYPSVISIAGPITYSDAQIPVTASWGVDEVRLNRNYKLKLKVFTKSKYVGPVQIYSSFPVAIGSYYFWPLTAESPTENDTGSFLQSVDLEPEGEDNMQWVATLTYAPFDVVHQFGNSDISQGIINPLDRVPEVYWATAKYERSKTEDEATPPNVFLNTVGDPLLSPPPIEETRPTLKIVRNESTYNNDYASQFKDSTNRDTFLGYPPNTVKCSDIQGERVYDADWGYYWIVTYLFEFRDDDDGNGYTEMVLNAGYRQLVGGSGDPQQILIGGQPITDAVPLQENGAYEPGADPYFIPFQLFPQVEFEGLNIPAEILTQNT
jgi:hypothetical protein